MPLWRGAIDTLSGKYSDLNTESPVTDYDRACAAAWPGRGVLSLGDSTALVLYSEYDEHTWLADQNIVASGSWLPEPTRLNEATWGDVLQWQVNHTDYLLMNSASDGAGALREHDFMPVQLQAGPCVVEFAFVEGEYLGCFHRLTFGSAKSAA